MKIYAALDDTLYKLTKGSEYETEGLIFGGFIIQNDDNCSQWTPKNRFAVETDEGIPLLTDYMLKSSAINKKPIEDYDKVEPKPSGRKFDEDKPRTDLLSSIALIEIAKVMTRGAKKYDAHNWRGGITWSRLLGACLRHVLAFLGGESKDPETGLSHLAHASCCLMFLLEFEVTKPELDDRYKNDKN